jgi:hypothetical protein
MYTEKGTGDAKPGKKGISLTVEFVIFPNLSSIHHILYAEETSLPLSSISQWKALTSASSKISDLLD